MQKLYNTNSIDINNIRWGAPPVPLLPASLLELWGKEPLPGWLIEETHLPTGATVSALGREYWNATLLVTPRGREYSTSSSLITPRVQHFILFLIKSRAESIKPIPCFSGSWPSGLQIAGIPFSVRSRKCLAALGFLANPELLMRVTFGQLLAAHNLGIKSLIEITTLTEFAVDLHLSVATEFVRGIGEIADHTTETFTRPQAAWVIHLNEVIRLAKGIGGISDDTAATPIPVDVRWVRQLTEIVSEPWADQISEDDPRFRALLSPGHGTLQERIERVMSDPAAGSSTILHLLESIPLIRKAIERLDSQFLEDGLLELLAAAIGTKQPKLAIVTARLGWGGEDPKTLQECGDLYGLTRERVRQIADKEGKRLPKFPILFPQLDAALSLLEAASPVPVSVAAELLMERRISRHPFSPISLLQVAEFLGRKTTLLVTVVKGERIVASDSQDRMLGTALRAARGLAGQAGVASVYQVIDRVSELAEKMAPLETDHQPINEDDVRRILATHQSCEFLDQDWFWFTALPEGRNRLENITKKILSVTSPQRISNLREGVRRAFKYRSSSNIRYRSLTVPPHAVLGKFLARHPEFRVDGESVGTIKPLNFRIWLGEGEQVLVDVFRTSPSGVLDRKTLIDDCVKRGLNENTVSVYTTYSPILEHIGLDLWKLRGVQVDPAAVEAVREQNQLRHRQTRLLNYGWTSDGKLWVAWRLPPSINSVVLGVPGAVLRYLANRSFSAFAKDSGRATGNISINDIGSSYGYSPFLRYKGADENDTFVAEFDLARSDVQLSITDESMLEQD